MQRELRWPNKDAYLSFSTFQPGLWSHKTDRSALVLLVLTRQAGGYYTAEMSYFVLTLFCLVLLGTVMIKEQRHIKPNGQPVCMQSWVFSLPLGFQDEKLSISQFTHRKKKTTTQQNQHFPLFPLFPSTTTTYSMLQESGAKPSWPADIRWFCQDAVSCSQITMCVIILITCYHLAE